MDCFVDGMPYGYTVVTFVDEKPVVKEGKISAGHKGLYGELLDVVDEKENNKDELKIGKNIVEIAPMQYGIVVESDNELKMYDGSGNKYFEESMPVQAIVYDNKKSNFIDVEEWTSGDYTEISNGKVISKDYLNKDYLISFNLATSNVNRYACAVQGLYNIAYLADVENVNRSGRHFREEYISIWNYTETKETDESKKNPSADGTIFGETEPKKAASGFIKYLKSKGYSKSYQYTVSNPTIAWLKSQLIYGNSILMSYHYNFKNEDEVVNAGHAIVVLGYIRAKKNSSGNTHDYLMVADGWDQEPKYINYSLADFTSCVATSFTIK